MLNESFNQVQDAVEKACYAASRDPKEVTIIVVSKTKPVSMIQELYDMGVRDFGENKVQELVEKYEQLPKDIRWHMIGHLQRNKVKYIIDKVSLIHSVDSLRLLETINREAEKKNRIVNVLIEINIAGEETKYGILPEELAEFSSRFVRLHNVKLCGLMTVAPNVLDPEKNRMYFEDLKKLSVDILSKNIDNGNVSILSMGMSGDYLVAIDEGATMVRIGSSIFGERNYTL